jgi:hypothetical protein
MEHAQVIEAMADVAGIAVEDDHQAARIRAGPDRDMPGVERFAVVGGERQCIEAQADGCRRGLIAAIHRRLEYQRVLLEIDQCGQTEVDQKCDLDCRPEHRLSFQFACAVHGLVRFASISVTDFNANKKAATVFRCGPGWNDAA